MIGQTKTKTDLKIQISKIDALLVLRRYFRNKFPAPAVPPNDFQECIKQLKMTKEEFDAKNFGDSVEYPEELADPQTQERFVLEKE